MRLADLAALNAARAARQPAVVVSDLREGTLRVVSGDAVDTDPLETILVEHLRLRRSGAVRHGDRDLFLTVHVPPIRFLVVGAVHIAQALAPMARTVGLDITVLDPRTAFATTERFPDTRLLPSWPDDVLGDYGVDAFTAVALLTHDPRIDDQALRVALRSRCFYIGALGSRSTQGRRRERMLAEGFVERDLARIHGPIGLDIGAISPAEIAVSILGEVVAAIRKTPPRAETVAA